jgi:hypothetical protein
VPDEVPRRGRDQVKGWPPDGFFRPVPEHGVHAGVDLDDDASVEDCDGLIRALEEAPEPRVDLLEDVLALAELVVLPLEGRDALAQSILLGHEGVLGGVGRHEREVYSR